MSEIVLQLQERFQEDNDSFNWTSWYQIKEYKPVYRNESGEILNALNDLTAKRMNLNNKNKEYRLVWIKQEVIGEVELPISFPGG